MKTITIRMLLAVAALALSGAGQAAPPPAEAFGRLPLLSDADLSPSGDRIVTIANVDGESVVAVLDTRGGPWKPVLKGETRDVSTLRLFRVSWCRFKTDQRILCGFRSDYIDDWARLIVSTRLLALDADGRNNRELMVRGGAGTALVGDGPTVAARINEYAALGIDSFVLSGYPHLEEAYRVGELLFPLLDVAIPEIPQPQPPNPQGEAVANDFIPRKVAQS